MLIDPRRLRCLNLKTRTALIVSTFVISAVILSLLPRVPLGAGYHDFADKRTLLGLSNCLDVLSNIPFFFVGAWGVLWLLTEERKLSFITPIEKIPYVAFFAGVALTGIGSYWYHLRPDNQRLPWDLLPMTISFMSMLVAVISERISIKAAMRIYIPALALGAASVVYWYFTEAAGRGDYRFYLYVQLFPPVLLAMTVILFRPRYTGFSYLFAAFLCFVLAKMMEMADWQVYSFTRVVSGHALKHVTAAVACYAVLRMLQRREPIQGSEGPESRVFRPMNEQQLQ